MSRFLSPLYLIISSSAVKLRLLNYGSKGTARLGPINTLWSEDGNKHNDNQTLNDKTMLSESEDNFIILKSI